MAAQNARDKEKLAGLILMGAAALALVVANSPLAQTYEHILHTKLGPVMPRFGQMSVHYWIADGLMAVFFLLVGLEVKREWYDGRLSTPAERRLPMLAAAAGMAVPALIYLSVTGFDPALRNGWAIPAATDIAFAMGVLALLGQRSNPAIKLLLVTIAIIDDVGAVAIIALFYTADLNANAMALALTILAGMGGLNMLGVRRLWPYLIGFALLWLAMLASGIHATIAGVLAALAIPLGRGEPISPLRRLEHNIHPWVMFGVMPIFGFASAGVHIGGLDDLLQPLPLGILAGLFIGKQLGVFGAIWLGTRSGVCERPVGTTWTQLYGASMLCGIGFTMSLFIGELAFPNSPEAVDAAKIGTLAGSLLAAVCGWAILRFAKPIEVPDCEVSEAQEIFGEDWPRRQSN
jgi:NhaA family Na+:H+ antiporter